MQLERYFAPASNFLLNAFRNLNSCRIIVLFFLYCLLFSLFRFVSLATPVDRCNQPLVRCLCLRVALPVQRSLYLRSLSLRSCLKRQRHCLDGAGVATVWIGGGGRDATGSCHMPPVQINEQNQRSFLRRCLPACLLPATSATCRISTW